MPPPPDAVASTDASARHRATPDERPRIGVFIPSFGGGGTERVVAAALPALADRFRTELVLNEDVRAFPVPPSVRVRCLGVETAPDRPALAKARRAARRVARLRAMLGGGRWDLVLSFLDMHNVWVHLLLQSLAATHGRRPPHVAVEQTVCAEFFRESPYGRRWGGALRPLLRLAYQRVDELIVLSRSMAGFLRDELRIRRRRPALVVYNGIDPAVFRPAARATAGAGATALDPRFARARVRLLNVGRLRVPQKRQDLLIDLVPRLRERIDGAELFFIGTGPDEAALRARARAVGCADAVHFLGWRDDLADYLRAADALVHTASYETFGNILIESLACGTEVVVRDTSAIIRELLAGRPGARLVPAGAADETLVAAVADAVTARRARAAGAAEAIAGDVRARFAMDRTVAAYVDAVEQTLLRTRAMK